MPEKDTETSVKAKGEEKLQEQLATVKAAFEESRSAWSGWLDAAEEDVRFYLSDQWKDADIKAAEQAQIPVLSINYIKKTVDLLSGLERQNKSDIKVLPIENSDDIIAEMISRIIKWVTTDSSMDQEKSSGYKNAVMTGLGWLHPYMSYDDDPLSGDIRLETVSPFNILPDPFFTKSDLSDCDYIIRHQKVSKEKLKTMYPEHASKIKEMSGTKDNDGLRRDIQVASDRNTKLLVVEYWHRVYEEKTFLIDTEDPSDIKEWEGGKDTLKMYLEVNPQIEKITRKIPVIRLTIAIENNLIVWDGAAPDTTKFYPFIPMFAFYDSLFPDWILKLQGVVRPLKDPQREKNKRRSQIMQSVTKTLRSGWFMDKGAVDDVSVLNESAGYGKVIQKNPGRELRQLDAPVIDSAVMQLEMAFDKDIQIIGAAPDLMGQIEGGSGRSAPGLAIQLRQKQGLVTIQEIDDNRAFATKILGKYMISLITKNFTREKIKRILNTDLPFEKNRQETSNQYEQMQQNPPEIDPMDPNGEMIMQQYEQQLQQLEQQMMMIDEDEETFWTSYEALKDNARYDVVVEESTSSPTYKLAAQSAILQAAQYGVQVPPEAIIAILDIPKNTKDQMLGYIQQQQQAQSQQGEEQKAIKQQEMQLKELAAMAQMKNQGVQM